MDGQTQSRLRTLGAGLYCWAVISLGALVLSWTALNWHSHDHLRLASYLLSAIVASLLKVRLPGVTSAVSVSFVFMLIGVVDLSLPEAIAIGTFSMLGQCLWRTVRRPRPIQVVFSVANIAVALYLASLLYGWAGGLLAEPLALGALALGFYFANTFSVASIISLTEAKPLWSLAMSNGWLLPYYMGGTSLAWMIGTMPRSIQWEVPIICLPVVYLVHRSYRTHLSQMEQENKHMEQVASVHMRTIEALALAIDAKDHTTHDHLQRVQLYAIEIGKELALSPAELDALRAAAVLHDIGKLAVPEHIISKPGKLTPAEFQKMKIHPVVGAEILERVAFPYPVVPIVRSHHEKWDGCGYPDGLKGAEIPIGARILAVVDCFDALASDRQYRRALPLDEAMARVVAESGTSFDPAVVQVLERRYRELETRAQSWGGAALASLSTDICITRGGAPAAGFAAEPGQATAKVVSIESHGHGLVGMEPAEAMAIIALRLQGVVPHEAVAVFRREGDVLYPEFVGGSYCSGLEALRIPVGEGLAGWVAQSGRVILNGNPQVEPGYRDGLQSALAVPIEESGGVSGVLCLYARTPDAFRPEHTSAVLGFCGTLAAVLGRRAPKSIQLEPLRQTPALAVS